MSPRSARQLDDFEDMINPLDNVEVVLEENNWKYDRGGENELTVRVAGKKCNYRLFFIWAEELSILQFCIQYDLTIIDDNITAARNMMMDINEEMIIGHFDLPSDTSAPTFRHSCLLRGISNDTGFEHLEDLIDISLTLCERHYSALSLLAGTTQMDAKTLDLALMETVGES